MNGAKPLWLRFLAASAAGALCAWIAPPTSWHWLHWFAWLPVFWALKPDDTKGNIAVGWVFGTFALGLIFGWVAPTIALYSNIPGPVSFLLLLLGAGIVFGWIYVPAFLAVHPLRRAWGAWWVLLFPFVLVANEFVVSRILIFPWQMGVAHYQVPAVFQIASVTGVWGVSWLVALVNAALAEVMFRRLEDRPFPTSAVAGALALWSINAIWGVQRFNTVEAELRQAKVVRIAQLQSPHDMVFRMSNRPDMAFREWVVRTRRLPAGSADIVVWPEGASPFDMQSGRHSRLAGILAKQGQFEMVIGGGTRVRADDAEGPRFEQFNSVFYYDLDGNLAARYDKMVPLVFGEYLPTGLNWLHNFVQGIGDFRAGTDPVVYRGTHANVSSPICYEAIFASICRQYKGSNLLINVTNDAWFGDTSASHLHGMLAAIRATELGITVFRSAYSGTSFVVEPHGNIHAQTPLFVEVARVVPVRLATVPTLYARFGDWFPWLCLLVVFGLAAVNPWRKSN